MARLNQWQQAALWIALNDEPTGSSLRDIQSYITVQLVADVFGKQPLSIAMAVLQFRIDHDLVAEEDAS